METKKKALGRGLEQLFSNERIDFENFEQNIVNEAKEGDIVNIALSEIRNNPYQPRKTFNEESLNELAESIKEHGVFQPIIVKKSIKGYELIAGERRTRASKIAGLETIPAIVKEFNDREMMEIALIENIQRENLNPIEEAECFLKIIKVNNYSHDDVAKRFGKSRSYVTNLLGLLRLPETVKNMVMNNELTMAHARNLSKLENPEQQIELANKIVKNGMSVRELEDLVNNNAYQKKVKIKHLAHVNSKYQIYEELLSDKIGSKVKIKSNKVELSFVSEEDLERILEILNISVD